MSGIDRFPLIRLLPGEVERGRRLTREEADRLISVCPQHLAALIRFALSTGCRMDRTRQTAGQRDTAVTFASRSDMTKGYAHA
jgi:integrase